MQKTVIKKTTEIDQRTDRQTDRGTSFTIIFLRLVILETLVQSAPN